MYKTPSKFSPLTKVLSPVPVILRYLKVQYCINWINDKISNFTWKGFSFPHLVGSSRSCFLIFFTLPVSISASSSWPADLFLCSGSFFSRVDLSPPQDLQYQMNMITLLK